MVDKLRAIQRNKDETKQPLHGFSCLDQESNIGLLSLLKSLKYYKFINYKAKYIYLPLDASFKNYFKHL